MAVIGIAPLVLKNVEFIVGTDDYRKHVDAVTFTPTSASITWTGLGLNSHTDVATATWTCDISYAQDWTTANSLSQYLYANEGDTVQVEFAPTDGGPSFMANIVITPGAIGGTVNSFATTTVTLGCDGKPTLVPVA